MATAQFNQACVNLLLGLMRDAQDDVTYDMVKDLHDVFVCEIEGNLVCPEQLQLAFIQLIKQRPGFRACLKEKNLTELGNILLDIVPVSIAGQTREVFVSLDIKACFSHDAPKKLWKRVKKLVISCNLLQYVYGDEVEDEPAPTKKTDEHTKVRESRVHRFNPAYRSFLSQLIVAFPPTARVDVLAEFDKRVAENELAVIADFKTCVLPVIPKIAEKLQADRSATGVSSALNEYFGGDAQWFKRLPLVSLLPVDEHWEYHMKDSAGRETIMKAVADLAICMSGVDTLIYSPIVHALRAKTVEIMKREKMDASTLFAMNGGDPSKSDMMTLVMELFQELPAATGHKITMDDLNTLLANTLSGKDEVPEAFYDVFSPDMLDMDCLQAITELPGIGDAIAPVLASFEGQMNGVTGAPAFGSVEKPAWL